MSILQAWHARRYGRAYAAGYDHAAGRLLANRNNPDELTYIEYQADNPFDDTDGAFNKGMQAAIAAFAFMTEGNHCVQTRGGGWVEKGTYEFIEQRTPTGRILHRR